MANVNGIICAGNFTFSGTGRVVNLNTGVSSLLLPGGLDLAAVGSNTVIGRASSGALAALTTLPALNASLLTALNATQLTSGTIPDARFPTNYPAKNGSAITDLNAAALTGTVPDACIPDPLPAVSGTNLTNLTAANLAGTIPDAAFPSTLPSTVGINCTTNLTAGTIPDARFPATLPAVSGASLTGITITQIGGLASGVATFLGTPTSANLAAAMTNESGSGALLFAGGALGTPASGTLSGCTGLPVASGISGLGSGIATFLATPTSANLRAAVSDEVGTGALYFVGGALGEPASVTLTNATGTAAGLTAGTVTTNANLTGAVTSVGNATSLGVFTFSALNTAVNDANLARTDAANTFTGEQTFEGAITTTATDVTHTIRGQALNITIPNVNAVVSGGFNVQTGVWGLFGTTSAASITGDDSTGAVEVTATTFRINGHDLVNADEPQTLQAKTLLGCVIVRSPNSQTGNYTLTMDDAYGQLIHPAGSGAGDVFTIPANASVAYETGTEIVIVNRDTTNAISIAINGGDTLMLSPGGTVGTRTLAAYGVATLRKIASTEWMISGTGLT